jgi:hypothetical protein
LEAKFFSIQQTLNIISSYADRDWLSYWREMGRIYSNYFLLFKSGSFLVKEANFPFDAGLTEGNYYTFFNEFFLISKGFFYLLLNSASEVTAKASKN